MAMHNRSEPVLIVGAGVFGLSTALNLASRGYSNVTVLDRAPPPVPDGSSVDVSRVIRCDYADPFYAKLAREAIDEWCQEPWKPHFHNTGFVLASETPDEYIDKCKGNLRQEGHKIIDFDTSAELVQKFPAFPSSIGQLRGYINPTGGWANAEGAIRLLAEICVAKGVSFVSGPRGTVKSLIIEGTRVEGVETLAGPLRSTSVILATGAWTNRLIGVQSSMSSSGQPVGFVQLSSEEAASLKDMPVLIDMSSGFFIFPPTPDTHRLKVARHSHGFEAQVHTEDGRVISSPKLAPTGASDFIPEEAEKALREGLRYILPQFADRPWQRRRLCWYTDTPEGNFVVDHHPQVAGLFIAAGGAGHAYKFLPVLGRYIADCFEDKATPEMRQRWRLQPSNLETMTCNDGSRRGPARRLLSAQEQDRL